MKKITAILAVVLVMAFSSTLFAAAQFSDVDDTHWAADAIAKLADLGLVEGFPDGTFKGNRTFTRYEMAMVVARLYDKLKTMIQPAAGGDCADCAKIKDIKEVKAIIDKLTAEFKDELAALGVKVDQLSSRLSAVEKDVSMLKNFLSTVKVSGTLRQRVVLPGTDMSPATSGPDATTLTALAALGDNVVKTWVPATFTQEPEANYEMFYYLAVEGMAADNIEVLVELDNYATDTNATGANTRSPMIDQAYVAMDFSDSASELDVLGVTAGYQYFSFGPYGLLVDNGFSAQPSVRIDLAKDKISLTGVAGLLNSATPINMPSITKDVLYAARLGIDLDEVKLGFNFLASGLLEEKGWGADLEADLFKDNPWMTGLTAEYINMRSTQSDVDADTLANDAENSYIVGLDVYKTKQTAVKVSYAQIGLTPFYSGIDNDPFSELDMVGDANANGVWDAGENWTASYESGRIIFPGNFEGIGLEATQKVLADTTLRFKAYKGDFLGGAFERPAYAEIGIVKPINKNATFGVDYKQYGVKNILLNMVRGELLVNF